MNSIPLANTHSFSSGNNSLGKDGDLTFLWSKNVNLFILDSNKNMIDFYIMSCNSNMNNILWKGTGIMGIQRAIKKL